MELVGSKRKTLVGNMIQVPFAIGESILGLVAYGIRLLEIFLGWNCINNCLSQYFAVNSGVPLRYTENLSLVRPPYYGIVPPLLPQCSILQKDCGLISLIPYSAPGFL